MAGRGAGDPFWHQVAGVYDRQLILERHALRQAATLARVTTSDRVLDVGTGTGELLRLLESHGVHPEAAVGLDSSAGMLQVARGRVAGRLVEADARDLPFADGSFTVGTCAYVLHLLTEDDRRRVLTEMCRVVTIGGRVVIVTPAEMPGRLMSRLGKVLRGVAALDLAKALCPYDPRGDLRAAGLAIDAHVISRRGYPSHCVRASVTAGQPA